MTSAEKLQYAEAMLDRAASIVKRAAQEDDPVMRKAFVQEALNLIRSADELFDEVLEESK